MEHHCSERIVLRNFVISFLVTLTFVFATSSLSQQAKPIRDFKDVAGAWEGKMESADGWSTPISMIIREDGTGDNIVPENSPIFEYTDKGRIHIKQELVEGTIRAKSSRGIGTTTLHEEEGGRMLKYINDDGRQKAIYKLALK